MKKKIYLLIVFIAIITTAKSYMAYTIFDESNIPVYDGVMNEKNQITSYIRFKNNFKLLERLNQVVYEFKGNPLSAGFSCMIALINPE